MRPEAAETIRVADLDLGQWELTVASVEARVEAGTVGQHGPACGAHGSRPLAQS